MEHAPNADSFEAWHTRQKKLAPKTLNEYLNAIFSLLHLEADVPFVMARASTTKNRKEALIPLHPMLAHELRGIFNEGKDESDPVFNITRHSERILYKDMEKAGIEKFDELGRKLDFHSLRNTFATTLAVNGTSQRIAQELMRHSDPMLTAKIYTDAMQLPTKDAVNQLPWIEDEEWTQIRTQNFDASSCALRVSVG